MHWTLQKGLGVRKTLILLQAPAFASSVTLAKSLNVSFLTYKTGVEVVFQPLGQKPSCQISFIIQYFLFILKLLHGLQHP